MKITGTTAVAAMIAAGLGAYSTAAHAQTLPIVGAPSSIQIGGFFPNSGDAKDRGGNTQLSADFRYHFPVPLQSLTPTRTFFDVGVQTGAKDGNHSTIIPITIGESVGLTGQSPEASGTPYAAAGVGAYILNQSGFSTATRIGGFGELGYNINNAVYVNARYQFVDHGNGPSVNVGFRF